MEVVLVTVARDGACGGGLNTAFGRPLRHNNRLHTETAPRAFAFARRSAIAIESVGAAFHHAPKHWNKCDEWSNCCSCRDAREMLAYGNLHRNAISSQHTTPEYFESGAEKRGRPHGKQSYKSRLWFHYTQSLSRVLHPLSVLLLTNYNYNNSFVLTNK